MSTKKIVLILVLILLGAYLMLGTLVTLRKYWMAPPELASQAYLQALQERDLARIYLYSDLLGPRLAGLMQGTDLTEDQKRHNQAKDFARWKTEFQRGSDTMDALRRERRLIQPQVSLVPVQPAEFRAEVRHGEEIDLVSYQNVEGQTYQDYYRLVYGAKDTAPEVSILGNVHSGLTRKLKSVVVRVEVRCRPDLGFVMRKILTWAWLDKLAFLYPFLGLLPSQDPSEVWMAGLSFDVDKLTLATF